MLNLTLLYSVCVCVCVCVLVYVYVRLPVSLCIETNKFKIHPGFKYFMDFSFYFSIYTGL